MTIDHRESANNPFRKVFLLVHPKQASKDAKVRLFSFFQLRWLKERIPGEGCKLLKKSGAIPFEYGSLQKCKLNAKNSYCTHIQIQLNINIFALSKKRKEKEMWW